ncbi:MAG: FAD-binding protein [Acetobacter peroxydans]|nr:FAD-binding protein [Acetobacter peroxydans]
MTGRIRRAPFAERAARRQTGRAGRVRFVMGAAPDMTPDSRRRDPRAERARQTVPGAAGRRRMIRGSARPGQAAAVSAVSAPRTIRVEDPAMLVLAVPDFEEMRLSRFDRQILGAARLVADGRKGAVGVLCPADLPEDQRAALSQAGADRLFFLPAGRSDPDQQARAILHWFRASGAAHILFPESPDGADRARRVAVAGGYDFMGGIQAFSLRAVIAPCHAMRRERVVQALPQVMTLEEDRVAAYAGLPHEVMQTDWQPEDVAEKPVINGRVRLGEAIAGDPASLPLAEAPFVVAAGNGVSDFTTFAELVRALGATPGASRVVCDAGHMPRQAQVGASGTVLDAACYLAMGISGAPQHLQGIGRVENIIAVNTDLHAAMVARASLAIIADAQEVMPALLRLAQQEGENPCV